MTTAFIGLEKYEIFFPAERVLVEDWRRYCNTERPHRSLGLQTRAQFAKNQRKQGSGSSRASPAFHQNQWKQNNKLKPPETIPSQVA